MSKFKVDKIISSILPFIGWAIDPILGTLLTVIGIGMLHVIYTAEKEELEEVILTKGGEK